MLDDVGGDRFRFVRILPADVDEPGDGVLAVSFLRPDVVLQGLQYQRILRVIEWTTRQDNIKTAFINTMD